MTSESPSEISEREREILSLLATGATNKQIAYQLNISANTVRVHVRNIFGKLGVTSRTEATVYALQNGLLEVPSAVEAAADEPVARQKVVAEKPLLAEAEAPVTRPAVETVRESTTPHHAAEQPPSDTPVAPPLPASTAVPTPVPTPATEQQPTAASRNQHRLLIASGLVSIALAVALIYVLFIQPQPTLQPTPQPTPESGIVPSTAQQGWSSRTALSQPRDNFAVTGYDGKLYVIGGHHTAGVVASVERYDPKNDLWVPLNDKPTAVSHIQAVSVRGHIYVPGGEDRQGNVLKAVEAYDPRTQEWRSLSPLPAPRSRYALASVEGRLYLFGGWDGERSRSEVFIYDPQSEEWSEGNPLPTARHSAGATFIDGYVYVIGGENEQGGLKVNERYNPVAANGGEWESVVPLPSAIAAPAVARFVNTVLVFDAENHTALQYTPATDAWDMVEIPDTIPLSDGAAVALNTSIFVFGAADSNASGALSEYRTRYNTFFPNVSNP